MLCVGFPRETRGKKPRSSFPSLAGAGHASRSTCLLPQTGLGGCEGPLLGTPNDLVGHGTLGVSNDQV